MITRLSPSPDWCVGIADQDMCNRDGTWKTNVTLWLRPWDAGVMRGNTYLAGGGGGSNGKPEPVQRPIRTITPYQPVGNPFAPAHNGQVAPVARIRIYRNRITNTRCVSSTRSPEAKRHSADQPDRTSTLASLGASCQLSDWLTWSPCSRKCGKGTRQRIRRVISGEMIPDCGRGVMQESKPCHGTNGPQCTPRCTTSKWSGWSVCTATCDKTGTRNKTRTVRHLAAANAATRRRPCDEPNVRTESCERRRHVCQAETTCTQPMAAGDHCQDDQNGLQVRYYYRVADGDCAQFLYYGCGGNRNNFRDSQQCVRRCKIVFGRFSPTLLRVLTKRQQRLHTRSLCRQPDQSTCNVLVGRRLLWYYAEAAGKCQKVQAMLCRNFQYFDSWKVCTSLCVERASRRISGATPQLQQGGCRVGSWSQWSTCSRGAAICSRARQIRSAGTPCPRLHETRQCPTCCRYTQWGQWSRWSDMCGSVFRDRSRYQQYTKDNVQCGEAGSNQTVIQRKRLSAC